MVVIKFTTQCQKNGITACTVVTSDFDGDNPRTNEIQGTSPDAPCSWLQSELLDTAFIQVFSTILPSPLTYHFLINSQRDILLPGMTVRTAPGCLLTSLERTFGHRGRCGTIACLYGPPIVCMCQARSLYPIWVVCFEIECLRRNCTYFSESTLGSGNSQLDFLLSHLGGAAAGCYQSHSHI